MSTPTQTTAPIYQSLRQNIFSIEPSEAGISSSAAIPAIWGLLMETGYPNGSSTLVMLADGTTSLYFSSGGGFLGCGEHPAVTEATLNCLKTAGQFLARLAETQLTPPPRPGQVIFYALTYHGIFSAAFEERAIGLSKHPFFNLFFAAQAVITLVRRLQGR